jgi:hypothetical protein
MAAKMRIKADPGFTAAITPLESALAVWRQQRKHLEPIPQVLWRRMVPLARRYGLSPIAQALRVNYSGLKHQVAASQVAQDHEVGTAMPSFVEVPVKAWPAAENAHAWVIELEDRAGCKLTLRMPPAEGVTVLTLAQGLWRGRA